VIDPAGFPRADAADPAADKIGSWWRRFGPNLPRPPCRGRKPSWYFRPADPCSKPATDPKAALIKRVVGGESDRDRTSCVRVDPQWDPVVEDPGARCTCLRPTPLVVPRDIDGLGGTNRNASSIPPLGVRFLLDHVIGTAVLRLLAPQPVGPITVLTPAGRRGRPTACVGLKAVDAEHHRRCSPGVS